MSSTPSPNTKTEIYLTEGVYRIVRIFPEATGIQRYTFIEHKCPYSSGWTDKPNSWAGHIHSIKNRGEACPSCNQPVSEGLQAAFWFLKEAE